jgi:hypothetical protein
VHVYELEGIGRVIGISKLFKCMQEMGLIIELHLDLCIYMLLPEGANCPVGRLSYSGVRD